MWEHFQDLEEAYFPTRLMKLMKMMLKLKIKLNNFRRSDESRNKLLVPYNACVELKDDFNFKYARFIETEEFIHILNYTMKMTGIFLNCIVKMKKILDIG